MMEDIFGMVAEEFDGKIKAGRVETESNPLLAQDTVSGQFRHFFVFGRGRSSADDRDDGA